MIYKIFCANLYCREISPNVHKVTTVSECVSEKNSMEVFFYFRKKNVRFNYANKTTL